MKGSSYKNYSLDWRLRLKPLVEKDSESVKEYRTQDAQRWLDFVARDGQLSRNSIKGFKAFLSSMFKEAKRLGYCDQNPVRDTLVPDAREPEDGYAYDLSEIRSILAHLPEPAGTIFAVAAFAGLRRGEIEGLQWPNYHDGHLNVQRSIWSGDAVEPKTKKSKAPVPVIKPLAERLEMHRLRCGEPKEGWIFSTSNQTPLSLHNVVNRVILPTLNRCRHCGQTEGDHARRLLGHTKPCAGYQRDERIPEWHGFHAARRGLGSNLNRLGVDDSVIQRILRHSNISTTQSFYIKSSDEDSKKAMQKLEDGFQDTIGTPSSNEAGKRELVN